MTLTKGLKIYGCSDDHITLRGIILAEIPGSTAEVTVGNAKQGGVRIRMEYDTTKLGVWTARISQLGEDIRIPWSIVVSDADCSAVVDIDCPEGTPVSWEAE